MPRPLRRVGAGGWVKAGLQEKRIFLKLKKNPKKNVATKLKEGGYGLSGRYTKKNFYCGFPNSFICFDQPQPRTMPQMWIIMSDFIESFCIAIRGGGVAGGRCPPQFNARVKCEI